MVKRYEPKCSCGQGDLMRPINDATEDADQYVEASDYDALDLELSQAYSERQREHELRVKIAGDAEAHMFWRPIETAPKDGTWVLGFGDGPGFAACNFVAYYGITTDDPQPHWRSTFHAQTIWSRCGPTHWMPLPSAPTSVGES